MKNLWNLLVVSLLVFGCAKNRDVERVRAGDRENALLKSAFLGEDAEKNRTVWLAKMTVVDTSDSPAGHVFVGFQGDVKIGYFDFNETTMNFRSLSGLQQGNETTNIKNPVLLTWDIDHEDYTLNETDGQTTNQEIKDNFKLWWQKKYFRVNWSGQGHNDHQMLPSTSFAKFSCWTPISRRRVDNSMKIEEDHIGFKVEVVYQREPACGNAKQWNQGDFNFTATYMYSFRKEKPSNYVPKVYSNEQDPARYKYGHFQTVRQILNPENGRPQNIFLENRWADKTQHFFFVKGFPAEHKWMWDHNNKHSIFGQTNALLKSLNSKLRFEIHDYNYNIEKGDNTGPEREFGDLRYSFVNFIEELESGGTPLGYGPSDTHPFTGEIIAANSMVWTGSLGFYLDLMEQVGETTTDDDGNPLESSLIRQMKAGLNVPGNQSLNQFLSSWDQKKGIGKIFKEMAQKSRYAYPFWNSYTSDEVGAIQVPTVLEKYDDGKVLVDLNGEEIIDVFTEVISMPTSTMPYDFVTRMLNGKQQFKVRNPMDVFDMEWMDEMVNTVDPEKRAIVRNNGLGDFHKIIKNLSKASNANYTGPATTIESIAREHFEHMGQVIQDNQEGHCIMDLDEFAGGVAGFVQFNKIDLADEAARRDFLNTVLYRVSMHEFGHNLNLRHNFYGSVDEENFDLHKNLHPWSNGLKVLNERGDVQDGQRVQISSSVMDYLRLEDEVNTPWAWESYDIAAISDSYDPKGYDDKGHLYLYCTDEHTLSSAICNRHDLGTTPSQILMSQIRSYDERYELRNKRFGRAYWNTAGYASQVFVSMMSMKEFLPMWRTAFAEDLMFEKMEELGINNKNVQEAYLEEMNREMREVMKLTMAFYQAVIQQSRGDRDYRSVYDETTGALQQVGIVSDKIFATMFLAGDDPIFYNPNRVMLENSYLTYSRQPGLGQFADRIWRNLITDRNIAMDPWFVNFARFMYAKNASNFANRGSTSLINAMKIVKVEDATQLEEQYGVVMDKNLPVQRLNLPMSKPTTFNAGDDVVIVHVDGSYYMTAVAEGHVTFSLFQDALDKLTGSGDDSDSIQQFNMDVREFYWLYDLATSGSLQ